jgi:hypothetical protein
MFNRISFLFDTEGSRGCMLSEYPACGSLITTESDWPVKRKNHCPGDRDRNNRLRAHRNDAGSRNLEPPTTPQQPVSTSKLILLIPAQQRNASPINHHPPSELYFFALPRTRLDAAPVDQPEASRHDTRRSGTSTSIVQIASRLQRLQASLNNPHPRDNPFTGLHTASPGHDQRRIPCVAEYFAPFRTNNTIGLVAPSRILSRHTVVPGSIRTLPLSHPGQLEDI